MNKARRAAISKAQDLLREAYEILEAAAAEERDAFDNMPESLQNSEKGELSSEYADRLDEMASEIDRIIEEDFSE